jgi:hypothetical protein
MIMVGPLGPSACARVPWSIAKLPIAPIFIADSVSLAVSREKNGKLRLLYAGWDDAKVVEPSEVLELRAS